MSKWISDVVRWIEEPVTLRDGKVVQCLVGVDSQGTKQYAPTTHNQEGIIRLAKAYSQTETRGIVGAKPFTKEELELMDYSDLRKYWGNEH